ncbi:hypothetical protein PENSPDRAFT_189654 [Peniophora sp. CONT]|nr:hypothetical protein PENSPDRAFT_189654 [Peniophora sp. CONT]
MTQHSLSRLMACISSLRTNTTSKSNPRKQRVCSSARRQRDRRSDQARKRAREWRKRNVHVGQTSSARLRLPTYPCLHSLDRSHVHRHGCLKISKDARSTLGGFRSHRMCSRVPPRPRPPAQAAGSSLLRPLSPDLRHTEAAIAHSTALSGYCVVYNLVRRRNRPGRRGDGDLGTVVQGMESSSMLCASHHTLHLIKLGS